MNFEAAMNEWQLAQQSYRMETPREIRINGAQYITAKRKFALAQVEQGNKAMRFAMGTYQTMLDEGLDLETVEGIEALHAWNNFTMQYALQMNDAVAVL